MTQAQKDRISRNRRGIPSYKKGIFRSGIGEKFCESCSSIFKCDSRIGDRRWRKQRFCSKSCALRGNLRTLGKNLGADNAAWKGGITPLNFAIRTSYPYMSWRREVFKRDDYTCQICNARGVPIHADHIKEFSNYPELRFELSNGRTLCVPCHKQTPNYAGRARIY